MNSSNKQSDRKGKIVDANSILLRYDTKDTSGQVTFHFKKGEGIVGHEIYEKVRWNDRGE